MDPYLEKFWPSFHTQLVSEVTRVLNGKLPADLVAMPEERLAITTDEELGRMNTLVADVAVRDKAAKTSDGLATITAPFKLIIDFEPGTERYIKILTHGHRLVTVIEFLSPSNKVGRGLKKFVVNRRKLLESGVHVVELDLVRRGNWRALLRPHLCPVEAVAEYRAVIRLGGQRAAAYVYPWPIELPLAPIPIPLRPGDSSFTLDLQPVLNDVYAANRYHLSIDYSSTPRPPLPPQTAKWANELLAARGILSA